MRIARSLAAATAAGALLLSGASTALAATTPDTQHAAARTAATVETATGTTGIAPSAPAKGTPAQSVTGATTVTVPATASGQITATDEHTGTLRLGLPGASSSEAVKTGNGTVVFPGAEDNASLAVQPTTDHGASALVTLNNAQAATTQRFTLDLPKDVTLVQAPDGGYELVRQAKDTPVILVGTIAAPWAKDAAGKPVPTSYQLDGNTLVQTVHTDSSTTFPVVADPKFTWGIVTGTAYFNKTETHALATASSVSGDVAAFLPFPWDGILASYFTLVHHVAQEAAANGECVEVKSTGAVYQYNNQYCY